MNIVRKIDLLGMDVVEHKGIRIVNSPVTASVIALKYQNNKQTRHIIPVPEKFNGFFGYEMSAEDYNCGNIRL